MGMVKLLMTWDILPGKENEYMEFITQKFGPGLVELGLQPTEAWYTVAGNGPQILVGSVAKDREALRQILAGEGWEKLEQKLLTYVTNYKYKVVEAMGHFQL